MIVRAIILVCLLSWSAAAATLRPFVSVDGPVVHLSDLFDGLTADQAIGPAPEPGQRIVVESAQLAAIARQFGIDWHPVSRGDRALLDRPGRPISRDDVAEPIRTALASAAAPDTDFELGAFVGPMVPTRAAVRVALQQFDYDPGTGRFAALLSVTADGIPPAQLRIAGRATEMTDVITPRRRLLAGDVVGPDDLERRRVRAFLARGDVVRAPEQAVGLAAKHGLSPGQPIQLADLSRPIVLQKGSKVQLALDSPGIQLTAQGVAMDAAAVGEIVSILNPMSKIVVQAVVTAAGKARVVAGAAPPVISNRTVVAQ